MKIELTGNRKLVRETLRDLGRKLDESEALKRLRRIRREVREEAHDAR